MYGRNPRRTDGPKPKQEFTKKKKKTTKNEYIHGAQSPKTWYYKNRSSSGVRCLLIIVGNRLPSCSSLLRFYLFTFVVAVAVVARLAGRRWLVDTTRTFRTHEDERRRRCPPSASTTFFRPLRSAKKLSSFQHGGRPNEPKPTEHRRPTSTTPILSSVSLTPTIRAARACVCTRVVSFSLSSSASVSQPSLFSIIYYSFLLFPSFSIVLFFPLFVQR